MSHSIDVLSCCEDADGYFALGLYDSALERYEQIRSQDVSFETTHVTQRMVDLHLKMGRSILLQGQVHSKKSPLHSRTFQKSLQLQPRNGEQCLGTI